MISQSLKLPAKWSDAIAFGKVCHIYGNSNQSIYGILIIINKTIDKRLYHIKKV